jgi:hypothetical protein
VEEDPEADVVHFDSDAATQTGEQMAEQIQHRKVQNPQKYAEKKKENTVLAGEVRGEEASRGWIYLGSTSSGWWLSRPALRFNCCGCWC